MTAPSVLILAAGKGVRMRSQTPKVLHQVGGVPMIERVIRTVQKTKPSQIAVVVGHAAQEIRLALQKNNRSLQFFRQPMLNGSGGAVRAALAWLRRRSGDVIVTCGDTPLLTAETFQALLAVHRRERNGATVLTTELPIPSGYGRIVRASDGSVERIVEHLDATDEERQIREINTGTYVFNARQLSAALPRLKADNQKKEFYLTDVLSLINEEGGRVGAHITTDNDESLGVNSRADLAKVEAGLRARTLRRIMESGVTVVDPANTYVDEQVRIAPDTVLFPQTFLKGATIVGSGCQIGPWAFVQDCVIENEVILRASFADGCRIRSAATVGPYSRLRPGSEVGSRAHVGNFSEIKKSRLAEGVKVNHLSYLGDAIVGKNVNIGAGTITCNYDGIKKSPTFIQDHAFIGSNTNLIAPVRIGAHAVVGAGSSISRDVPAWALAVERAPTQIKKNWAKKKFSKKRTRS